MGSPALMPDNPFTRMIERVSQAREERIAGAGVVHTGGPLPQAQSAAVGREVLVAPPLSDAERAELDAKAIELGIMPRPEGEEGNYASLEEAQAAGTPVEQPTPVTETTGITFPVQSSDRMTAREFLGRTAAPRLPDFSKVGGIDLIRDVVYVDGMEFSIPKAHADEYRLYVVRRAQEVIMQQIAAVIKSYTPGEVEGGAGGDEEV